MTLRAILAVDEGTTNSKAVLVGEDGVILASAACPVATRHPRSGWVEQNAQVIWDSTLNAVQTCIAQRPEVEILGLGISNQRESILIWDRKTGLPLGPVITWQCRRTAEACDALKSAGHEPEVIARTGLPLDPMFPATKVRWLLDAHRDAGATASDDICIGTVDAWLIWKFSGGTVHACDTSNAARTQLFNLAEMRWDPALCELFDVPRGCLPAVHDSSHVFGTTLDVTGLPDGLPIAAAIGDSHGALFGHGAVRAGDGKITFGTGSSVMTTISEFVPPPTGITTTIAWSLNGTPTYAFEGNILVSAAILPWTASLLGQPDVASLLDLAKTVESTEGVNLVPAHVGLGAPHWNSAARGVISGLSFPSGPAHIARAAAESMAFQVQDVFAIIEPNSPDGIGQLFVDGGPSRDPFLMGLVADYLDHPVSTCETTESSAMGAAFLAGLAVGLWPEVASLDALRAKRGHLAPSLPAQTRAQHLVQWAGAVTRATLEPQSQTNS